eukprot:UN06723
MYYVCSYGSTGCILFLKREEIVQNDEAKDINLALDFFVTVMGQAGFSLIVGFILEWLFIPFKWFC